MMSQRKSVGAGRPSGGFCFGRRKRQRLAEYPCVSRLRQRRLILFLFSHEFVQTHDAFIGETAVLIDVRHLHHLVIQGQWSDAIEYLSRFLPPDSCPLGVHGRALLHFLRAHRAINDIVTGARETLAIAAAVGTLRSDRFATGSPALLKLRSIFSSLLDSKTVRESLDMARVRWDASSIMDDLLDQTPELKDHMRPCRRGSMNPQNVLPLGFGQASFRRRRHVKKQGGRVPASVVAGLYLQKKKKMLPSPIPSDRSQGLTREDLVKAKEWLAELVDRSVEAGKPRQSDPVRSTCSKGVPGQQTSFCTRPRPDERSRFNIVTDIAILKEAREWMLYLTEERLEAWPDMPYSSEPGAFAARLSKIVPDAFKMPVKCSSILTNTEAGVQNLSIQ